MMVADTRWRTPVNHDPAKSPALLLTTLRNAWALLERLDESSIQAPDKGFYYGFDDGNCSLRSPKRRLSATPIQMMAEKATRLALVRAKSEAVSLWANDVLSDSGS